MKHILLKCTGDLKLYCHKVFSHVTLSIFESEWFECAGRRHDPLLGGIGLKQPLFITTLAFDSFSIDKLTLIFLKNIFSLFFQMWLGKRLIYCMFKAINIILVHSKQKGFIECKSYANLFKSFITSILHLLISVWSNS